MALIARLAESKGGCNKSAPSLVETKFGENRTGNGCGRNIINMKSMIRDVSKKNVKMWEFKKNRGVYPNPTCFVI